MRLLVEDVAVKEEWIARMSLLLHDALVVGPPVNDAIAGTLAVDLRRVGHELGEEEARRPLVGRVSRHPYVRARLAVHGVRAARGLDHRGLPWDREMLTSLHLTRGGRAIRMSFIAGTVRVDLGEGAGLELHDEGRPDGSGEHVRVLGGGPVVRLGAWSDVLDGGVR